MSPYQRPLPVYLSRKDITDKQYKKFLDTARRDTTIYDLIETIETYFGKGECLGLWYMLGNEINTQLSRQISNAIKERISYAGVWEESFSGMIERKKWRKKESAIG